MSSSANNKRKPESTRTARNTRAGRPGPSETEREIRAALGDLDVDFDAFAVVSNVNRVSRAIRNYLEQNVLATQQLSWSAFATLFEIWIWGPMESQRLATQVGITKATMTGVVDTLESRRLLVRKQDTDDKRVVLVSLTDHGRDVVSELFPVFNDQETTATAGLSRAEMKTLASGLRTILNTLESDNR